MGKLHSTCTSPTTHGWLKRLTPPKSSVVTRCRPEPERSHALTSVPSDPSGQMPITSKPSTPVVVAQVGPFESKC
jgi:hypothetical protein